MGYWFNTPNKQIRGVIDTHRRECEERYSQKRAEGGDEFSLPRLRHHVAISYGAQRDLQNSTLRVFHPRKVPILPRNHHKPILTTPHHRASAKFLNFVSATSFSAR